MQRPPKFSCPEGLALAHVPAAVVADHVDVEPGSAEQRQSCQFNKCRVRHDLGTAALFFLDHRLLESLDGELLVGSASDRVGGSQREFREAETGV